MHTERLFAVDRLAGNSAILVDDDGKVVTVPRERLPHRLREGDVLRVAVHHDGAPDWGRAEVDRAETERRKEAAGETLDELKGGDPGGDVTL